VIRPGRCHTTAGGARRPTCLPPANARPVNRHPFRHQPCPRGLRIRRR
jgi:hypothetical protein